MLDPVWEQIIEPDRTFIIAEAGVNHNGSLNTAKHLVDMAVTAGVDAVKFQTFKADRLVCANTPKADYQCKTTNNSESQLDMLRGLELSDKVHGELMAYCQKQDILFMSTPFDEQCADFLNNMNIFLFKIPSGEITNLPFLSHVARLKKPMIVSTGMANLYEIEAAVNTIIRSGNKRIVLLHCISKYPTDPVDANLRAMETLKNTFGTHVGFSDHTPGTDVSVAAVALGACVVEKHLTLDRNMQGPDHHFSLEPKEMAKLVQSIRTVEESLGHGRKEPSQSELEISAVARKSLIASLDINPGTILTKNLITAKRPGTGLPPSMLDLIIGRTISKKISAGTQLTMEIIQ